MALKVKAVERKIKFTKDENDPGVWRYVMQPELYIALSQAKVIKEAALRSGVSEGVMQACWDAAGEVIKAWLPEGHSVPLVFEPVSEPGVCSLSSTSPSSSEVTRFTTSPLRS